MVDEFFQKGGASIVTESIEGEVVIINLDSGAYYSLESGGAYVWNGITGGLGVREIKKRLSEGFPGLQELDEKVSQLVSSLLEGELIRVAEVPPAEMGAAIDLPLPEKVDPFELECYTDMKDLLMLDPIHEVEESGWPRARTESDDA